MNKICKLKPPKNDCKICNAANEFYDFGYHCSSCMEQAPECELVAVGYNRSVGEWAMVIHEGQLLRVEADRVCEIKDK